MKVLFCEKRLTSVLALTRFPNFEETYFYLRFRIHITIDRGSMAMGVP